MCDQKNCHICEAKITPKKPAVGVVCKTCSIIINREAQKTLAAQAPARRKKSA